MSGVKTVSEQIWSLKDGVSNFLETKAEILFFFLIMFNGVRSHAYLRTWRQLHSLLPVSVLLKERRRYLKLDGRVQRKYVHLVVYKVLISWNFAICRIW